MAALPEPPLGELRRLPDKSEDQRRFFEPLSPRPELALSKDFVEVGSRGLPSVALTRAFFLSQGKKIRTSVDITASTSALLQRTSNLRLTE